MRVAILGRGRVGGGLSKALSRAGHDVRLLPGRRPGGDLRWARVTVLAVPDAAIAPTAERLAPRLQPGTVVLHCAGTRDAADLQACEAAGTQVGVMHPLISFADRRRPPPLSGATFTLTGSAAARRVATQLVRSIGAHAVTVPVHGAAYHAAAALTANGAAALAAVSTSVLVRLSIPRRSAERALAGLLRSVAHNIEAVGLPAALTGPVARGEASTVSEHRAALARVDRQALRAYDAIVPILLVCAQDAGLSPSRARAIRRILEGS